MPRMGGIETTIRIRQTDKETPIVAMSAHALGEEKERALKSGMNEFLSKPFYFTDLQRVVKRYVLSLPQKEAA